MGDLKQELEDAQNPLRIVGEEHKMYQLQLDRVLEFARNGKKGTSS
jgi:hypothetical protein